MKTIQLTKEYIIYPKRCDLHISTAKTEEQTETNNKVKTMLLKPKSRFDLEDKNCIYSVITMHDSQEITLEEYKKTCLKLLHFIDEQNKLFRLDTNTEWHELFRKHFPDNLFLHVEHIKEE